MRLLAVLLAVGLVGCQGTAPQDHASPVCVDAVSPEQHIFSDGVTRKSNKATCSNGCVEFTSLDASAIQETTCH